MIKCFRREAWHSMYIIQIKPKMKRLFIVLLCTATTFLSATDTNAQSKKENENQAKDSIYIHEIEEKKEPAKLLHAEPLYIDLIRDLGARKGEKEWNVGLGLTDNNDYDEYTALVEYEWAPVNRLGLEVELPFSIYYPNKGNAATPGSKLNSIKIAGQYTFLVAEKEQPSLAIGYIQEFELTDFKNYGKQRIYSGNVYNPFFVAAKRWGNNVHSLLYTGPAISNHFNHQGSRVNWQINSNIHYMISGTRNFIGIEFNKEVESGHFDMTIRPQMRVAIADNFLIGIVTGIPVSRKNERFSSFLRLIYEPGHKKVI